MSFELIRRFGVGGAYWEYTPVKSMEDGWKKVFAVVGAVADVSESVNLEVEGPYHNEKEFGDIGWKKPENEKELRGMLNDLLDDDNYSGKISVVANGKRAGVRFQISIAGDGDIGFVISGEEETVRFLSTVVKKALGE